MEGNIQQQKKRPRKETDSFCAAVAAAAAEEVAKRRAAVEQCRADIDRLQRELAEKKAALEENERALETAAKALMAAEAQSPAAAEASGHFAMLSDFEILEILRCLVPAMPPRWESDEAAASLKEKFSWLCAVSATCRRLHALASSPELWCSLDPGTLAGSEQMLAEKLCSAPWLSACEVLSFHLSFTPSLLFKLFVEKMPNLRMLKICLLCLNDDDDNDDFVPGVLCELFSFIFLGRVFPRITELGLKLPRLTKEDEEEDEEDEEVAATIARAFPNLRKLSTTMDLGAFWQHCHHLEVVAASESSHLRFDVLAASPCSQTLCRFCGGWQVDCTELARAAPNLITVELIDPTNISGLAGLAHLQELVICRSRFEDLNELDERAHGMRLKKLVLLKSGDDQEADLTRLFGSPCCSQLELLDSFGFMIDSCIAGLTSQSGPLPLRSFFSRDFPSNLSALLAKCPALTEIEIRSASAGRIAQSLGTTPSIAPVLKFSAPLSSAEDLLAVGNVFGRTLQVVKFVDIKDQAAIDAFVASCPHLSSIRFGFRIKHLPRLPPWTIAEKIDED